MSVVCSCGDESKTKLDVKSVIIRFMADVFKMDEAVNTNQKCERRKWICSIKISVSHRGDIFHHLMALSQHQYWVTIPFSPGHQRVAGEGGVFQSAEGGADEMRRTKYNALNALKHLHEAGFRTLWIRTSAQCFLSNRTTDCPAAGSCSECSNSLSDLG